jgi:uncharacterized protein YegL
MFLFVRMGSPPGINNEFSLDLFFLSFFFPSECKLIADVAFLIDSSGSVGRRNWVRLLTFVTSTISKLNVGPTATHIAIVRYSSAAEVDFTFRTLTGSRVSAASYNKVIKGLRWQRGFTYIDRAIVMADRQVFTPAGGMRANVPKVN